MTDAACKRVLAGLRTARVAVHNCTASLRDERCQASLRSGLGSIMMIAVREGAALPSAAPQAPAARPTARQRERVMAELSALLQALAEERHPSDEAWQTATLAAVYMLCPFVRAGLVAAEQLASPAGCSALLAVVRRLLACCDARGPPPSGHGLLAVVVAARVVVWVSLRAQLAGGTAPAAAGGTHAVESGLLLIPLVLQLFAPPQACAPTAPPPPPPPLAPCTCANAAGRAPNLVRGAGAAVCAPLGVYGCHIRLDDPSGALIEVLDMCLTLLSMGVGAPVPAWTASLWTMVTALDVHAGRQRGHPRALSVADGGADPARFVHPGILAVAACGGASTLCNSARRVKAAAGAVLPTFAPSCAACLPDQLMLLLEASALVDDPPEAAECYERQLSAWAALANHDAGTAASVRAFWRRARPHVVAHALEAARAVARTPASGTVHGPHTRVVAALVAALSDRLHGCVTGFGAALDTICETIARAHPSLWALACACWHLRLDELWDGDGGPLPPCTFLAATVTLGKLLHAQAHNLHAGERQHLILTLLGWTSSVMAPAASGGDDSDLATGAGHAGGAQGAGPSGRRSDDAAPPAASEGGVADAWASMSVLVAARVMGTAAHWWRQEDGEAMLTAHEREAVVIAAAVLRQPCLRDAVRRGTHARLAPLDSGGQPTADAPTAEAGTQRGAQGASDDAGDTGDGGGGASACTATLRFLAELHDRLDPHALGVRLPGCYNPRCTNLSGASEAVLPVRMCAGCRAARYCSVDCSKQHWRWHKAACRLAASSDAHSS